MFFFQKETAYTDFSKYIFLSLEFTFCVELLTVKP